MVRSESFSKANNSVFNRIYGNRQDNVYQVVQDTMTLDFKIKSTYSAFRGKGIWNEIFSGTYNDCKDHLERIQQKNPILSSHFFNLECKPLTKQEQYNHPLWQKKRLEIMQRDNWTCRCCGESEMQLQIHHLQYNRNGYLWEVDNEVLVTVCDPCHQILHNELPKLAGLIAFQILSGELDPTLKL